MLRGNAMTKVNSVIRTVEDVDYEVWFDEKQKKFFYRKVAKGQVKDNEKKKEVEEKRL